MENNIDFKIIYVLNVIKFKQNYQINILIQKLKQKLKKINIKIYKKKVSNYLINQILNINIVK